MINWGVNKVDVSRGDVFYADLNPVIGSEQGGVRPVVVIQNDIGNKYSPTVIVAAITSRIDKAKLPTHVEITAGTSNLEKDSVILLEQIRTLDKKRLQRRVTSLDKNIIKKVDKAVEISLGLIDL